MKLVILEDLENSLEAYDILWMSFPLPHAGRNAASVVV